MARLRSVLAAAGERPALVVGALVALVSAVVAAFTTRMTTFQPDELGYTKLAITMGDTMSPLALDALGRDRLNQLYPLTISPFYALWGNASAYSAAHVWNAILMASTAIPAYLLARSLLPSRWMAYLAAALVVAAPWMTIASVQLTEVAAYPAAVWAYLAMHRAMSEPSPARDVIALAAIGVAAFGRLQLVILWPLLVAAVLVHEVGFARRSGGDRRAALQQAARGHAILLAAALAGVVIGLPLLLTGVLADKFGFYGNTLSGDLLPNGTWRATREGAVALAFGLGVIPAAIALGGWLEALVVSRAKAVHAFAVMSLLICGALLLQVGAINVRFIGAALQERYIMFLGPLLLIGLVVGLAHSRRPPVALALGIVVLVPLIAVTDYESESTAFWYLTSPGITTFLDVVAPPLRDVGRALGDSQISAYLLMAVVSVLIAIAAAVLLRRLPRMWAVGLFGGMTLLFSGAVTTHAFVRLLYGVDGGQGLADGVRAKADWVDRGLPDGQGASLLARQLGPLADTRERWWTTEFWNRKVDSSYVLGGPAFTYNAPREAKVGRATGRIRTDGQYASHVVASTSGVPLEPVGRRLAISPNGRLALVRISRPLRVRWAVEGISDDGWLGLSRPATLSAYEPAPGPSRCQQIVLTFTVPAAVGEARGVTISGGRRTVSARIPPGARRALVSVLCGAGRDIQPLRIAAHMPKASADAAITMRLSSVRLRSL